MISERTNVIICGHIDHGKSTFTGRFLYETGNVSDDKLKNMSSLSKNAGQMDFSLITDALKEENAKSITIGISQHIFKLQNKEFAFLDAPGHFEFLQNMITGAAKSDLAFVILDAKNGIQNSTVKHMEALSFLRPKTVIVLVNKMDLVDYQEAFFDNLREQLLTLAEKLSLRLDRFIPISATQADNLTHSSNNTPWYNGSSVLDYLLDPVNSAKKSSSLKNSFLGVIQDVYGIDEGFSDKAILVTETMAGVYQSGQALFAINSNDVTHELKLVLPEDNAFGYNTKSLISFYSRDDTRLKRGDIVYQGTQEVKLASQLIVFVYYFNKTALNLGDVVNIKLNKREHLGKVVEIRSVIRQELTIAESIKLVEKGQVAELTIQFNLPALATTFEENEKLGRLVIVKDNIISAAGKIKEVL